jgi:hypothetical protein
MKTSGIMPLHLIEVSFVCPVFAFITWHHPMA